MPTGAGRERLRRGLARLVEPPSHVQDPQTRRQLRVLLAILAVLTPLAYGVFLAPIQGALSELAPRETLLGLAAATGLLAAYVAGRLGRYVLAAATTMVILLGAIWGFALLEPVDASGTLIYLILPVFLTSLLLGPRGTAVVSVAVLASILLEIFPHRALATTDLVIFLLVHLAVIGVGTLVRSGDLERIADQARTLGEKETTLRLAQQVARVGSWSWDVEADRVELSVGIHRIFGTDPDLPGAPMEVVLDRFRPGDRRRLEAFMRGDLETGDTLEIETRIVREGTGEERDIVLRGRVQGESDRPLRVVGVVQDVTERRRLEEQARKQAREEARREELEHVLDLASHQLREPLRNITGHGQLLGRHLGDDLDDDVAGDLVEIRRAVQQMDATLTDLKTYITYATARPDVGPVDADRTLREACDALADRLADPGVTLGTEPLPSVQAEPSMLRRVLLELIDNAIAHRDGDTVRISVHGRRDDDRVVLTVSDDGPGIPPEARHRVLELFQRLDRTDPKRTGLGLALCRRIVENLDGSIRIASSSDGGTAVEVELPAAEGDGEEG